MKISVVGQNIKRIREKKNLSAYKLAKLAGIGSTTLYEIENGARETLKTTSLEKIASALNVNVNELLHAKTEVEYVVTDILETLEFVLDSDELTLDGIELSNKEKEKILNSIELTIELIRKDRH